MVRSLFSLVELTKSWHGISWALMKNRKLYKPRPRHAVGAFYTFSCASTLLRNMALRLPLTKTELYVLTKKKPSLMNVLFHHPKAQDQYMMMVRRWLFRVQLIPHNIHCSMPKTEVHPAPAHKLHLRVTDVWQSMRIASPKVFSIQSPLRSVCACRSLLCLNSKRFSSKFPMFKCLLHLMVNRHWHLYRILPHSLVLRPSPSA